MLKSRTFSIPRRKWRGKLNGWAMSAIDTVDGEVEVAVLEPGTDWWQIVWRGSDRNMLGTMFRAIRSDISEGLCPLDFSYHWDGTQVERRA